MNKSYGWQRVITESFVVLGVATLGVYCIIGTRAATPSYALEAEAGTLSGSATIITGSSLSGGKAVQFGTPTVATPTPTPTPPPTPTPTSKTAAATTAGFYPCAASDKVSCLNTWASRLNRAASSLHVMLFTDPTSASNMSGNGYSYFDGDGKTTPYQWQNVNPHPTITIAVPLAFGGQEPTVAQGTSEMTAVADGTYDANYQRLATYAYNAGYKNVIWRLGWEFDGNWMPWTSRNDPSEYIAAYQHVHDIIKAIMPGALFDWCGSLGETSQWNSAYPGNSYVDTIGMDIYDFNDYTTQASFNSGALPSLQYQENFAVAHGKQISTPEWGLGSHDNPQFIQMMYNWFNSVPASGSGSLAYNDYFDSNEDNATTLESNPNSEALYIKLFGY